jgi:hypothetical protein
MKRMILSLSLSTALLSTAILQAAELPVRQVILYKHGVGYFERHGRLAPGESARLDFKPAEMNDVLKSLTIAEQGGGKITGLRYDSLDPLSVKLAEFPFKLGDAQPLSAVLDQLKGARLELKFGAETVAGAIVAGRVVPGDDKRPEREQLTLLLDSGELRTVDLAAATGVHFPDPQLQRQFRDYLAALTAARSKDKRSVYIDSTGSQAREVTASYMVPAPVWKSSYRLIFGDAGQPVFEGWAIVDNTTSEDWTKVQLALVSGRPISFVTQLYAPKYVTRPAGELPDETAAGPVVHEGGFAESLAMAAAAPAPPMPAAMTAPRQLRSKAMLADAAAMEKKESTLDVDTVSRAAGDLFEYRLAQPVTIRKNESAMLPFLQQKIDARKLLIYTQRTGEHPMNAAELTNSTGKTLDGGPITVYDAGAYAGEALMETLKATGKRLVSYAVDLGTRITTAFGSHAEVVREVHASRGILVSKMAVQETRTYTIRNLDQKAKTLIVEHPLRAGYTLLSGKPVEKTSTAYRFEVKLAAGASAKFVVPEERVYDSSAAVTNLTPDEVVTYIRNRNPSEAGRKQLEQIAARKAELAEANRALQGVTAQIASLTADEERVRRNIESLNRVSGQQQQVQQYAAQLAAQESQIAQARDRQAELEKKRATLEAAVASLVQALSF